MSAEDCKKDNAPTTRGDINPYLYFKGTANAAIDFYVEKLGANVEAKMLFSQGGPPVPEEHKDCVMHAMIKFEDSMLMMSDDIGCTEGDVHETTVGNNVTLNINWNDVDQMKKAFEGMSEGGKVLMPLAHQFWGATYGKLVDKFGVTWSFNCHDKDYQEKKKPRTD
jgi:PhnB protein